MESADATELVVGIFQGNYDTVQIADYSLPPMVMKTQKINLERLHMVFSTYTSVNLCIDNIYLTIYPS